MENKKWKFFKLGLSCLKLNNEFSKFFWGNLDRVKKLKIVMLNIVIWNLKEC